MKKYLFSKISAATVVAGSLAMVSTAHAADGTITFTGTISEVACAIAVNSSTANQSVALGSVSKASLGTTAGTTSAAKDFTIGLSNCPAALTTATVNFDGVADTADNQSFRNNEAGDGAATGVGVRIYNNGGGSTALIPPHGASVSYTIDTTTNSVSIPFTARMVNTTGTIGAGTLTSTSNYTINYQ